MKTFTRKELYNNVRGNNNTNKMNAFKQRLSDIMGQMFGQSNRGEKTYTHDVTNYNGDFLLYLMGELTNLGFDYKIHGIGDVYYILISWA